MARGATPLHLELNYFKNILVTLSNPLPPPLSLSLSLSLSLFSAGNKRLVQIFHSTAPILLYLSSSSLVHHFDISYRFCRKV
ncbi:hypothetical protein L1987_33983 [Smallanthus sonchifolius]|uniref:Uncharacterized protein n=1 Tax=Smallanthus sonchifolius TaxID=185202 RepID=A0ACB9HSK0_9ASTR|nr:hypothetical protein L1987_33983 [Smallanthus sonchifolius]